MSRYLYVDNYRGFSNTLIELKQTNFFVGENSTGKTSILSLLKLMSDYGFEYYADFNSVDTFLGSYQEIAGNSNPIFIAELATNTLVEQSADGAVEASVKFYQFENEEGMPQLKRFTLLADGILVSIQKNEREILARSRKGSLKKNVSETEIISIVKSFHADLESTEWVRIENPFRGGRIGAIHLMDVALASLKIDRSFRHRLRGSLLTEIMTWLAPIRAKPKRTYDGFKTAFTSEGDHAPYILKRLFESQKNKRNEEAISSLKEFGESSGLYKAIEVNRYSKDEASPFELKVKIGRKHIKVTNVGYGISQVIPIIAELVSRAGENWFAIQQPEVHLHPKAQAALGGFFYHFAKEKGFHFLVETHSDYLIDRFRLCLSKDAKDRSSKDSTETNVQILFFERSSSGNRVTAIPILSNGKYSSEQPKSFKEFFLNEQLELIRV